MGIQAIPYSPQWHSQLLDYMKKVYPYRSGEYFDWWLSNVDVSGQVCWDKCVIVTLDDVSIIGCTTWNTAQLMVGNDIKDFFVGGNTIMSPEHRGKGIGKGLYEVRNRIDNWLCAGITDVGLKANLKFVKSFTPIKPLQIYVFLNFNVIAQFLRKLLNHNGRHGDPLLWPEHFKIGKKKCFVKVNDVGQIDVPQSGRWTDDKVEMVRDKEYCDKRFFRIYCAQRYGMYKYEKDGKLLGYAVFRRMRYKGFDMVSVVDYRFMDRKDERLAFIVANKLAKRNNIGFVFGMSSRSYGFFGRPILLRARKRLICAVGTKEIDFSDALITSADADLDFVYYE